MVRDLMLDQQTRLTELPMVTLKPRALPPGPIKAAIINTGQRLLMKVDDTGGKGGGPLAKLALKLLQ